MSALRRMCGGAAAEHMGHPPRLIKVEERQVEVSASEVSYLSWCTVEDSWQRPFLPCFPVGCQRFSSFPVIYWYLVLLHPVALLCVDRVRETSTSLQQKKSQGYSLEGEVVGSAVPKRRSREAGVANTLSGSADTH